jgi:hypothetical protein
MSFLRKLFGLSGGSPETDQGGEAVEHEGYLIRPAPIAEGGQFRLCAVISRDIGGETREHRMVRADLFASREEAAEAAVRKAKLVIKEQGERMFA